MLARLLPITLLSLWTPAAFAFPPCPQQPVEIDPIDGPGPALESTEPRHQVWYAHVGNAETLSAIVVSEPDNGTLPGTGNCRADSMIPLPGFHSAAPGIGLMAPLAPLAGYGLLALPDLRSEPVGASITYRLNVEVDNTPLAAPGDWVDVMQFIFRWDEWPNGSQLPSTLYRLRIRQPAADAPILEVIETRAAWNSGNDTAPVSEDVVATIPLNNAETTPIALRWFQINRGNGEGGGYGFELPIESPIDTGETKSMETGSSDAEPGITTADVTFDDRFFDARFEILGPGDTVLYGVDLTGQWADELWMGLLNHHTPTAAPGVWSAGVLLENSELRIEY